jgi:hypothetical protein
MAGDVRARLARVGRALTVLLVWGTWLTMLGADLWLVREYGLDLPRTDDWVMVPQVVGRSPVTLRWLWTPQNEHRIPLPRLVYLAVVRGSGNDFRAGMVLNVAMLTAAAGLLILASRWANGGRTRVADAFFPLALMGWMHYENMLWCFQISMILPVLLLCAIAAAMNHPHATTRARAGLVIGICLPLLVLTGGPSVAAVPLALWLGAVAAWQWWQRRNGAGGARGAAVQLGLSVATLAMMVAYVAAYQRQALLPPGQIAEMPRKCVEFLSVGWGLAAAMAEPRRWGVLAGVLVAGAVAVLLRYGVWRRERAEQLRAAGLLACVVGLLMVMGSVAYARGTGVIGRYVVLSVPLLCVAQLIYARYGTPTTRRLVPLVLLAGMLWWWPANQHEGKSVVESRSNAYRQLEDDVRAELPLEALAVRNHPLIYDWDVDSVARWVRLLHDYRLGPYKRMDARLVESPGALEPMRIEPVPSAVFAMDSTGKQRWVSLDGSAFLEYRLPRPLPVRGIRMRFVLRGGRVSSGVTMSGGPGVGEATGRSADTWTTTIVRRPARQGEQVLTFWPWSATGHFRLTLGEPERHLQINEITLLLDPSAQP